MTNTIDLARPLLLVVTLATGPGCADGSDGDGAGHGGAGGVARGDGGSGAGGDAAGGAGGEGPASSPFCDTIEAAAEACTDPLPWEPAASCPAAEVCWRGLTRDDVDDALDDCLVAAVCTDPGHCFEYLGGEVEPAESLWQLRFACVDKETACGPASDAGILCERMRAASANLLDDAVSTALLACLERDCGDVQGCVDEVLDGPLAACGWAVW